MASELAERLAACRKAVGLSQTDVAAALNISRQSVSKWERGDTAPSEELFAALASLYGVTPEHLRGEPPAEEEAAPADTPAPADESAPAPEEAPEEVPAPAPEEASGEAPAEDSNPAPEEAQGGDGNPKPAPQKAQSGDNDPKPAPQKAQSGDNTPKPTPKKAPTTKKKAKKSRPSAPPFRTVADVDPNEMAYVYVDKNDGKWRTLLPFFAALPLCAGVFALVIRHKFKK